MLSKSWGLELSGQAADRFLIYLQTGTWARAVPRPRLARA